MTGAYEIPTETGEQRLQRMRDRNYVWQQRGMVVAAIAGCFLWWAFEGGFEEGLGLGLAGLAAVLVAYLLVEAILHPIEAALNWVFSPFRGIFRPLSSRGYSYYDDEEREERENPTPDYSRAERIPEDYR